jgi:hypothetical protein
MVMRDEVPSRLSWRVVLGICGLALLALPAFTLGQATSPYRAVDPAAPSGENASEREQKVRDLEKKVDALLNELKALRAEAAKGVGTKGQNQTGPFKYQEVPVYLNRYVQGQPVQEHALNAYQVQTTNLVQPPVTEVTLSRATYTLPAAKAEALSAFLRDNVKAAVLETKHDGDKLIVTTTPEAQRVIGQLIALMRGKRAETTRDSYLRPTRELDK